MNRAILRILDRHETGFSIIITDFRKSGKSNLNIEKYEYILENFGKWFEDDGQNTVAKEECVLEMSLEDANGSK